MNKYDAILLDPPWSYSVNPGQPGVSTPTGAALHYDLMTDQDVFDMDIKGSLNDPGVVFCWATGPKLDVAMRALSEWGLHYRGVAFVWVKTKADGQPWKAKGVRPSVVKPLTEFVLVGSTKKTGRPLKIDSESVIQTIFSCPREHSRKPEEVRDRIDVLYPTASKLEMFSRGPERSGWDLHGNEVGKYA